MPHAPPPSVYPRNRYSQSFSAPSSKYAIVYEIGALSYNKYYAAVASCLAATAWLPYPPHAKVSWRWLGFQLMLGHVRTSQNRAVDYALSPLYVSTCLISKDHHGPTFVRKRYPVEILLVVGDLLQQCGRRYDPVPYDTTRAALAGEATSPSRFPSKPCQRQTADCVAGSRVDEINRGVPTSSRTHRFLPAITYQNPTETLPGPVANNAKTTQAPVHACLTCNLHHL